MRAPLHPLPPRTEPPRPGQPSALRNWLQLLVWLPLLDLAVPLPQLQAQPMPKPPPPPFNPAWAFDPDGPALLNTPPPSLLLPGGGGPFNPNRPNEPMAISRPRPPVIAPCPLIVPVKDMALQPLHIPPAQVPFKNRFGCLSPGDAIYGPDGCPRQLCGEKRGNTIKLPPGGP